MWEVWLQVITHKKYHSKCVGMAPRSSQDFFYVCHFFEYHERQKRIFYLARRKFKRNFRTFRDISALVHGDSLNVFIKCVIHTLSHFHFNCRFLFTLLFSIKHPESFLKVFELWTWSFVFNDWHACLTRGFIHSKLLN